MEQNSQRGHQARGEDATGLDGCSGYEWAEATEAVVPSVGGVIGKERRVTSAGPVQLEEKVRAEFY